MDNEYISTQLKKFNITDAAIAELKSKYIGLIINGAEDLEGYKKVRSARLEMKSYRIDVDKRRKELTADALAYQRAINEEAKRITNLIKPIEDYLENQEKSHDEEKERIKKQKEQEEILAFQNRVNILLKYGYGHDGINYTSKYTSRKISLLELKTMPEKIFESLVITAEKEHGVAIERQRQAEIAAKEQKEREEAAIKAEQARIAQEKLTQALERERLAEESAKLAAEKQRLEAEKAMLEKQRLEAEKAMLEKQRLETEKAALEEKETLEITKKSIDESSDDGEKTAAAPAVEIKEDKTIPAQAFDNIKKFYSGVDAITKYANQIDAKVTELSNGKNNVVYRFVIIMPEMIYNCIDKNENLKVRQITEEQIDKILTSIDNNIDCIINDFVVQTINDYTLTS